MYILNQIKVKPSFSCFKSKIFVIQNCTVVGEVASNNIKISKSSTPYQEPVV